MRNKRGHQLNRKKSKTREDDVINCADPEQVCHVLMFSQQLLCSSVRSSLSSLAFVHHYKSRVIVLCSSAHMKEQIDGSTGMRTQVAGGAVQPDLMSCK